MVSKISVRIGPKPKCFVFHSKILTVLTGLAVLMESAHRLLFLISKPVLLKKEAESLYYIKCICPFYSFNIDLQLYFN
jgi:hypothetical protein